MDVRRLIPAFRMSSFGRKRSGGNEADCQAPELLEDVNSAVRTRLYVTRPPRNSGSRYGSPLLHICEHPLNGHILRTALRAPWNPQATFWIPLAQLSQRVQMHRRAHHA